VCEEVSIESKLSISEWQRPSQQLGFYSAEIVGRSFEDQYSEYGELEKAATSENIEETLQELEKLTKITDDFLKVDVTRRTRTLAITSAKRKASQWDFMSSAASFMNLFSGVTLIVLVELIDYVIHILYIIADTRKAKKLAAGSNGTAATHHMMPAFAYDERKNDYKYKYIKRA
jgi:hypothetical protein